jgi:hypothetical protein
MHITLLVIAVIGGGVAVMLQGGSRIGWALGKPHSQRSLFESVYVYIASEGTHIYRHMCMILLTIFSGSDAVEESGSLSFWDVSRVILG